MLLLKLTIVPLFIALVTVAGRKWGTQLAGLLGGLPVVAGPIVVILALEQGAQFGVTVSVAAIAAVAALLGFGVAYAWAARYWRWPAALLGALAVWAVIANLLVYLAAHLWGALLVALVTMLVTPRILPNQAEQPVVASSLKDLPWRMVAGAALTLAVTQSALLLGGQWSGVLAAFPIIGSILAVFTHIRQGAAAVAQLYRGMVRGFYSFSVFFAVLACGWLTLDFWLTLLLAILVALLVQAMLLGVRQLAGKHRFA